MRRPPLWFALAAYLSSGAALSAQDVKTGAQQTLTFRGFLSGTLFLQDALFAPSNGQGALYVATGRSDLEEWWHGGDVRNARIALDFAGPTIAGDWRPGATVEIDFFGPFSGTGNFSDEQPLPRLRLAFVDLTKGGTRIRFGQDWSLTTGVFPTSVAHLGFPLGWGSGGFIGWRFPGISLRQRLTAENAPTGVALQLALLRGSWSDEPAPDGPSAGEVGIPQLEARLDFNGKMNEGTWVAYVVGHYDQKDLAGIDPDAEANELSSWALEAGGSLQPGPFTLQGNAYVGKAMAHQFAHILQFDDIGGWGVWAQAGVNLSPTWSLWGYFGTDNPDDEDVRASDVAGVNRLKSWLLVPMLRFRSAPYSLGFEWLHNKIDVAGANATVNDRRGNQLLLSVRYDF
jgi:hypothetical protein